MKIKDYNKATPIIDELQNLNSLIMPDFEINKNTKEVQVVKGNYTNATGIIFNFHRNDYGNYAPVISNNDNDILLEEHEYIELKKVINTIIASRINIQSNKLDKIK